LARFVDRADCRVGVSNSFYGCVKHAGMPDLYDMTYIIQKSITKHKFLKG
jgi:hypothetical protein